MNELEKLKDIDIFGWILVTVAIITAIIFLLKLIQEFASIIGKPIGWKKRNDNDHHLIEEIVENISKLQEQQDIDRETSNKHDAEIKDKLTSLEDRIIDKDINDMRFKILDFASAISSGREFSREQYSEVINTHDRYESMIKKYGRKNGKVDLSMEIINKHYLAHMEQHNFENSVYDGE